MSRRPNILLTLDMAPAERRPVSVNAEWSGSLGTGIAADRPQALDRAPPARPVEHPSVLGIDAEWTDCIGPGGRAINSPHPRSIDRVAPEPRVRATALDGIVAAMAPRDDAPVVGVQWPAA